MYVCRFQGVIFRNIFPYRRLGNIHLLPGQEFPVLGESETGKQQERNDGGNIFHHPGLPYMHEQIYLFLRGFFTVNYRKKQRALYGMKSRSS